MASLHRTSNVNNRDRFWNLTFIRLPRQVKQPVLRGVSTGRVSTLSNENVPVLVLRLRVLFAGETGISQELVVGHNVDLKSRVLWKLNICQDQWMDQMSVSRGNIVNYRDRC